MRAVQSPPGHPPPPSSGRCGPPAPAGPSNTQRASPCCWGGGVPHSLPRGVIGGGSRPPRAPLLRHAGAVRRRGARALGLKARPGGWGEEQWSSGQAEWPQDGGGPDMLPRLCGTWYNGVGGGGGGGRAVCMNARGNKCNLERANAVLGPPDDTVHQGRPLLAPLNMEGLVGVGGQLTNCKAARGPSRPGGGKLVIIKLSALNTAAQASSTPQQQRERVAKQGYQEARHRTCMILDSTPHVATAAHATTPSPWTRAARVAMRNSHLMTTKASRPQHTHAAAVVPLPTTGHAHSNKLPPPPAPLTQ